MFDFTNYTYSGLLSLISALFSIGYPLIMNSINRIDTKYSSTLLTAKLQKEKVFLCFNTLLIVNLIFAVLIPFLMYGSCISYLYIIFQAIGAIALITTTFCLFHIIMLYSNPTKLCDYIWSDYKRCLENKSKKDESLLFSEWIDLSKTLLSSADQKTARKFYDGWMEYITHFYKKHRLDNNDYDLYFYDGLTRLNETLCKMPSTPISINNGNDILTSLVIPDKSITKTTYIMLWRNLRIQLFFGKDDWIMEYWTHASQKYDFYLRKISTYEINEKTGNPYTEEDVKQRDSERWVFLRFHIMLCAMIMEMGKYKLLGRILKFTQSYPPTYPLIPSDIAYCCWVFNMLNRIEETDNITMNGLFQMPGMDGISEGRIQGAANKYMSLLVLRIYTLIFPYGPERAMQPLYIPNNLHDLKELGENMETLVRWLKKMKQEKHLLKCLGIIEWEDTLKNAQDTYGDIIRDPEDIINKFVDSIKDYRETAIINLPYDDNKVAKILNTIETLIIKGFKDFDDFLCERKFNNEDTYWINGSSYMLYPNVAFYEKPDISYVDIEDTTGNFMLRRFYHYFGTTFISRHFENAYNIDAENIFECFDSLSLNDSHFIISFGIYWDYYLGKSDDFVKEDSNIFKYKRTKIINIKAGTNLMAQQLFILNYDDRPYLTFERPTVELQSKYNFKQYCDSYNLWLSIQKVVDHPDLISDEDRSNMSEAPETMSVLAGHLVARCHWKKGIPICKIHIKHKLIDNGNIDDISIIVPFENNHESK